LPVGVHLGRHGLPDGFQLGPGAKFAAGHQGRAEARAFLAAGHARADEAQAFFPERLLAADRVGPKGVATVDDDVPLLQQRNESVNDRVRGLAGLHEDDHLARLGDRPDEFLKRLCPHESAGGRRVFRHKPVGFLCRAVVNRNLETVVGDVEGEVLTHHRETDESDVGICFGHRTDTLPHPPPRPNLFFQKPPQGLGVVCCLAL
jgi:hypothetical protein